LGRSLQPLLRAARRTESGDIGRRVTAVLTTHERQPRGSRPFAFDGRSRASSDCRCSWPRRALA
jgi:hypothetical protein